MWRMLTGRADGSGDRAGRARGRRRARQARTGSPTTRSRRPGARWTTTCAASSGSTNGLIAEHSDELRLLRVVAPGARPAGAAARLDPDHQGRRAARRRAPGWTSSWALGPLPAGSRRVGAPNVREHLGQHDAAVLLLAVLDQRDDRAPHRHRGAVERVHVARALALRRAVARRPGGAPGSRSCSSRR